MRQGWRSIFSDLINRHATEAGQCGPFLLQPAGWQLLIFEEIRARGKEQTSFCVLPLRVQKKLLPASILPSVLSRPPNPSSLSFSSLLPSFLLCSVLLMSVTCGVECVVCIGCSRWAWKRCAYVGSDDSATWTTAIPEEFGPVPRVCRAILAVYEPDLAHPQYSPNGGFRMNPSWVVKRVTYEETHDQCPPYIIYVDHDHREIIVAVRGLNLRKESDYKVLMDNRLGMQMFAGGYVHHGLLKAAVWLLDQEADTIKRLWLDTGSTYKIIFAGHSLGSGVAALMTVVVVNNRDKIGGVPREKIRCYAVAPARCMSLNLAVKYADVIHSIVLQVSVNSEVSGFLFVKLVLIFG
ncbi:hypothetical protein ACLOJK_023710 [Asimina triloba]